MVDMLGWCYDDFRALVRDVFGENNEEGQEMANEERGQEYEPVSSDQPERRRKG